ncbi:unnamed protein product [Brachionus calyciflorus]|uniref:tRNA (guanine(10)-N(2))-methyltransferase TRMT11 n=1 Tax=Brachionus calyciflorus TaxID=104777 RepID=A0A814J1I8_9BILA|nr:unnamed protein product [Brachionus calyciflorus]
MINDNLYLFHLTHDYLEFRFPELQVICESIGHSNCITSHTYTDESPLFTCNLPSDKIANQIGERSFLLKSISKLISQGNSLDDLIANIEQENNQMDLTKGDTFKIDVYSYGKIYSQEEKLQKIEKLVDALKFEEKELKVCLNDKLVKHKFFYAEEWIQSDEKFVHEFDKVNDGTETTKAPSTKYLRRCYIGKFLCNGQSSVVFKYNLKDRGFIGNTSMDPLLSLVMANMGNVNSTSFVYDPFVGTGSLLVGAAHCGAHVAGADLDYNLVHSRGLSSRMGQKYRRKDETIRNNLKQYGFESKYLDILAADFSSKYIRDNFKFDAIITDPPYGIREKAKKLGSKKQTKTLENNDEIIVEDDKHGNFVKHIKYNLGDIFYDLLDFASKHLVLEGRLVFWLPVYMEEDRNKLSLEEIRDILVKFIPKHEDLILSSFSEQRLTKFTSRLLVTMKKKTDKNDNLTNLDRLAINDAFNTELHQSNRNTDILNQFRDKYFAPKK